MNVPLVHKPVFLHGLWRSGSTFVWSRFRTLPETCCFYEPLHQGLGRLTAARIGRDTPEKTENNRHPVLDAPYFAEFAPLLKRRGVRGFAPRMSWAPYALPPETGRDAALETYIGNLCAHAAAQGKQAVLGFNRAGLRMGWMTRRFDAVTLHIDRDPRALWHSYRRHLESGNATFFTAWLLTVERNAAHPLFRPLAQRLPLRRIPLGRAKDYYRRALENMPAKDTYFMVYYLWLATTLHALAWADVVIPMDRLTDPAVRTACESAIAALCGRAPHFSAARPPEPLPADPDTEAHALAAFPANALEPFLQTDAARIVKNLEVLPEERRRVLQPFL